MKFPSWMFPLCMALVPLTAMPMIVACSPQIISDEGTAGSAGMGGMGGMGGTSQQGGCGGCWYGGSFGDIGGSGGGSGIGGTAGTGGTGGVYYAECNVIKGDPGCNSCLAHRCGAECEAFTNEPTSTNWLECVKVCKDQACVDDCNTQYPKSASVGWVLFECIDANCSCDTHPPTCGIATGVPTCDHCNYIQCYHECSQAAYEPTFFPWLQCIQYCHDQECLNDCDAATPIAAALGKAFFACMEEKCAIECEW